MDYKDYNKIIELLSTKFNKDPQIRWFRPSEWEAIKDYISKV